MKLITELNESTEYLEEMDESSGKKEHYIRGIFLQANKKNKNGRVYPAEIMEQAVDAYKSNYIDRKRAWGELGHPDSPKINLPLVSHLIVELKRDGDNWIGKAKLADTPNGNIAKGLLKTGGVFGVSSRGVGTLAPNSSGIMEVQQDFKIATAADIVNDPSAPDAFVEGIMEGAEWLYDPMKDTWLEGSLHEMKSTIRKMSMDQIEQQKFSLFEQFMDSLTR